MHKQTDYIKVKNHVSSFFPSVFLPALNIILSRTPLLSSIISRSVIHRRVLVVIRHHVNRVLLRRLFCTGQAVCLRWDICWVHAPILAIKCRQFKWVNFLAHLHVVIFTILWSLRIPYHSVWIVLLHFDYLSSADSCSAARRPRRRPLIL